MSNPWAKFFWSDWETDPQLRLCSLAAQGLWMRCLCIAAKHDPTGYVAVNGRSLLATDLAQLTGVSEPEVTTLLAELDRNGVFSRDRTGRIYSRRMVRDAKKAAIARKNGKKGGNPTLRKHNENQTSDKGEVKGEVKPHKPEARIQKEEEAKPPGSGLDLDAIENACRKAGKVESHPSHNLCNLAPILGLLDQGFSLERDILPSIRRQVANGKIKTTWAYFVPGIIEDREKRSGAPTRAGSTPVSDQPVTKEKLEASWRWALNEASRNGGVWKSRSVRKEEIPVEFVERWKAEQRGAA